jgi:hypothetical protein
MQKIALAPLLAAIAPLALAVSPTYGASNRVWVSGHGADASGCGSPASPCRSFQYALDNVVADGGEIDVLDPAGYGAISITKSVSIVNDGVGTAGVQAPSAGNGVTVTTASGATVHLRGLTIEGAGIGANGIVFNGQGALDIVDCVVRHFTAGNADGVFISPNGPSVFSISETIVSDNANNGVHVSLSRAGSSTTIGVVTGAQFANNGNVGLFLDGAGSGVNGSLTVSAVGTVASNNGTGFEAFAGGTATATLALRNDTATNNTNDGIFTGRASSGTTTVRVAHSVITNNAIGLDVGAGVTVFSYVDNNIDGNATNVSGSLTPAAEK